MNCGMPVNSENQFRKRLAILGSTGSIGTQALDVAEKLGCPVMALTARSSVKALEEQARRFRPRLAVLTDRKGGRRSPGAAR